MLREAAFSQGSEAIPCRRRCEGDRQRRAKEVEWEGGRVSERSVLWVEVVVAAIHDEPNHVQDSRCIHLRGTMRSVEWRGNCFRHSHTHTLTRRHNFT